MTKQLAFHVLFDVHFDEALKSDDHETADKLVADIADMVKRDLEKSIDSCIEYIGGGGIVPFTESDFTNVIVKHNSTGDVRR